jgi:endonuclease YncB( thermonuclease family)
VLCLAAPVAAQQAEYAGPYLGRVVRVIDGDTFEAEVRLWPTITARVSVRLKGFDAPELLRPACEGERLQATLARAEMVGLLPEGQEIVLENVEAGSFAGRVVADVYRVATVNRVDLAMLPARRAAVRPWTPGEPAIDWCARRPPPR